MMSEQLSILPVAAASAPEVATGRAAPVVASAAGSSFSATLQGVDRAELASRALTKGITVLSADTAVVNAVQKIELAADGKIVPAIGKQLPLASLMLGVPESLMGTLAEGLDTDLLPASALPGGDAVLSAASFTATFKHLNLPSEQGQPEPLDAQNVLLTQLPETTAEAIDALPVQSAADVAVAIAEVATESAVPAVVVTQSEINRQRPILPTQASAIAETVVELGGRAMQQTPQPPNLHPQGAAAQGQQAAATQLDSAALVADGSIGQDEFSDMLNQAAAKKLFSSEQGVALAATGEKAVHVASQAIAGASGTPSRLSEAVAQESRAYQSSEFQESVGSQRWGDELSTKVRWLINGENQSATLKLKPAELGNINVRVVVEGDQARIQFVVQNPQAREALEAAMPRLRDLLEQGGLNLAQSDVHSEADSQARHSSSYFDENSSGRGSTSDAGAAEVTENQRVASVSDRLIDYYI